MQDVGQLEVAERAGGERGALPEGDHAERQPRRQRVALPVGAVLGLGPRQAAELEEAHLGHVAVTGTLVVWRQFNRLSGYFSCGETRRSIDHKSWMDE